MKFSFPNIFFSFLLLFLLSCSDQEKVVEEDRFVVPETIETFSVAGGSQSITFVSTSAWQAVTDQEWCTVSPTQGLGGNSCTLQLTADPNPEYVERNGTLTLTAGNHVSKLTIIQKQKDAILLTSSKYEATADGGAFSVQVKSNVDYSYSIDKQSSEWISVENSRGLTTSELHFNISENTNVNKREGHITFYSGDLKETFSVYQCGVNPELVLTKDSYIVSPNGEELKIELQSNLPYKLQLPDVDWLKENESKAMSSYTHYITILPNSTYDNRTASIHIKHLESDLFKDIQITQLQKDALLVPDTTYNVSRKGQRIILPVSSNVKFNVKTTESWIIDANTMNRSLQDHSLTFNIERNPTAQKRSGFIILTTGSLEQKIQVNQEPNIPLEILSELTIFSSKASEQKLKISSLDSWSVKTNHDWCSVTPKNGPKGAHTLLVKVATNKSIDQRTDSLTFVSGSVTKIIPIVQSNMDKLIISTPDIFSSGRKDSIISVKLQSTSEVKAIIDSTSTNWILPISTRALTSSEMQFKLLKNDSVPSRKGVITFEVGTTQQKLNINQKGQGLQLTFSKSQFVLADQEQEIEFTVKSNFKYTLWMYGAEWIQEVSSEVIPTNDKVFTTTKHKLLVTKNTTLKQRILDIAFLNQDYQVEFGTVEDFKISVIQDPMKILKIKQDTYNVPCSTTDIDLSVITNVDYTVLSDDWIKRQSQSRAALTDTIAERFTIQANHSKQARTGSITLFYSENLFKKIIVNQSGNTDYDFILGNELSVFASAGGIQTLKFDISNDWEATIDQEWCNISHNQGLGGSNQIKINVLPNANNQDRNAVLCLKSGNHIKRIPILQKGKQTLLVSTSKIQLTKNGGYFTLHLNEPNNKLKFEYDGEFNSWIKLAYSPEIPMTDVRYNASANNTGRKREATIRITSKSGVSETVNVYQENNSSEIILTDNSYRFDTKGGDIKIELRNASSYKMIFPNEKWLQLKKFPSSNTYYVSILPNATYDNRNASILFNKANGGTESVNIFQKQVDYLEVDTISHVDTIQHVVAWDSIALRVDVTSNIAYNVSTDQKWIKQRPQSRGLVTDSLYFDLDKNLDDTVRTAYITIAHDKKVVRRIKVVQNIKPNDPKPDPGTDPKPEQETTLYLNPIKSPNQVRQYK